MRVFQTSSPKETVEVGRTLGAELHAGSVVALTGDLGAGKTHFVHGLAEGWGTAPNAASSPTFALLHEYTAPRGVLRHLDLYRAKHLEEVWASVHDELDPADGLLVIEWADRFPSLIPTDAVRVEIRHGLGDQREIRIES